MNRILPLAIIFAFFYFKKANSQELNLQFRNFNEGYYIRLEADVPISKKFLVTAGASKDALQMLTILGGYKINDLLTIKSGFGYHKKNSLHGVLGLNIYYKKNNFEFNGYINSYIDHVSLYASECELLRKFTKKWSLGLITDVEIGKKFERWSEVKEEMEKEKLLLGGGIIKYRYWDKFNLTCFAMYGKDHKYKIGIGSEYEF